uniref:Serine/threonine-protein kinase receptor n=1 Tax=Eptatretus burgeri TaxID=7764 RepID=A0A8C4QER4_EPTBU
MLTSYMHHYILIGLFGLVNSSEIHKPLLCYCKGHHSCRDKQNICKTSGQCLVSGKKLPEGSIDVEYRCLHPIQGNPNFNCNFGQSNGKSKKVKIKCCKDSNFCNKNLTIEVSTLEEQNTKGTSFPRRPRSQNILEWLLLGFLLAIVIGFVYFLIQRKQPCLKLDMKKSYWRPYSSCKKQMSPMQDISLKQAIGRGRFGEVFYGEWHGRKVAVKVFQGHSIVSYDWELSIYKIRLMIHPNIVAFLGAANISIGSTYLYLITEYHQHGSLRHFISKWPLLPSTALRLFQSAASGLAYLHQPIGGAVEKPEMAHRDLKSSNMLVKSDLTVCLADFGLTATCNENGQVQIPLGSEKAGTPRYMAPEILNGTMDASRIQAYIAADMYSFGLVLWEITCCTSTPEIPAEGFQLPFQNLLTSKPKAADVWKVVSVDGERPPITPLWRTNKVMLMLVDIMEACWNSEPTARPSSLNVKLLSEKRD